MKKGVLVGLMVVMAAKVFAQSEPDTSAFKRNSLIALPVAYYLPETRWGFGATVNYTFRFKNESDSSRSSQLLAGFAYTQEKQLLLYAPFQLFWDEANFYSYGELGYYKYFYNYYGIGSDSKEENSEPFTVDYPRFRINLMRKTAPNVYLGGQYWFENYNIKETEEGGELGSGTVTGGLGGVVSGYGVIGAYDTRNGVYYPTKGSYFESAIHYNPKALGSDFEYGRFRWDARHYHQFKWKHVLALNAFGDHTAGAPPFHLMGLLGGPKRLRGLYEGRFRDKNALILQAEYRLELPFRFGLVAFAGTGTVAPTPQDLIVGSKWHPTAGGGLRFMLNKEEHVNIRLDVGFTPEGTGFYLTFGEAF